jgi:putative hydrolase of the HAD superfamily
MERKQSGPAAPPVPAEGDGAADRSGTETIRSWVFDLDNTLYPARCNLFDQIDRRMAAYISGRLGLDEVAARRLQKRYYHEHGTTLRGLMLHHGIDPAHYLDYVHDIDMSPVPPSPALDRALAALDGRKLIFTNGSVAHAERVVARLGIAHHFEAVFDIAAGDYLPKPHREVYRRFVTRHGVESRRAAMFEDTAANLRPAAALGMTTVWVRPAPAAPEADPVEDHIHHVTHDVTDWLDRRIAAFPPRRTAG